MLLALTLFAIATPYGPASGLAAGTVRADLEGPDGNAVVARHQAGDMVVDWLVEPPPGADAWVAAVQAEESRPSGTQQGRQPEHPDEGSGVSDTEAMSPAQSDPYEASGAGEGFAVFADGVRLLPDGYTVRLAGGDARIEEYRDELQTVAAAAARLSGLPIRVAPGIGGAATPGRGEIVVVLGDGPCGAGATGCGGPSLTSTEVLGGRVWVGVGSLRRSPTDRLNLAAHELGHALGLRHYSARWNDGVQVMYPQIAHLDSYRDGDGRGLRFLAGNADRPAGAITATSYAAGRINVTGTLDTGTTVRVQVGSATREAKASGGRFAAVVPARAGTHRVCATVVDPGSGFRPALGCVDVLAPGAPFGQLEAASDSFETVHVSGWASDPQTADPVRIEIRRNGVLVATVPADRNRRDVEDLHPAYGPAHGFRVAVPAVAGTNAVCIRVLGTGGGGNTDLGCRTVVHPVDPIGAWDLVAAVPLGVRVAGWALDPNAPSPIEIQSTVDGTVSPLPSSFTADGNRDDVARRHPAHGPAHGFSQDLRLPPGEHRLCLRAKNVGAGADRSLGCADVVVASPTDDQPSSRATVSSPSPLAPPALRTGRSEHLPDLPPVATASVIGAARAGGRPERR